jgi:hypothetical protein
VSGYKLGWNDEKISDTKTGIGDRPTEEVKMVKISIIEE